MDISTETKFFIEKNIYLLDSISKENIFTLFQNASLELDSAYCNQIHDILVSILNISDLADTYIYPWIIYEFETAINAWKLDCPDEKEVTLTSLLEGFCDPYRRGHEHLFGWDRNDIADMLLDKYNYSNYFNDRFVFVQTNPYLGVMDIKRIK